VNIYEWAAHDILHCAVHKGGGGGHHDAHQAHEWGMIGSQLHKALLHSAFEDSNTPYRTG